MKKRKKFKVKDLQIVSLELHYQHMLQLMVLANEDKAWTALAQLSLKRYFERIDEEKL